MTTSWKMLDFRLNIFERFRLQTWTKTLEIKDEIPVLSWYLTLKCHYFCLINQTWPVFKIKTPVSVTVARHASNVSIFAKSVSNAKMRFANSKVLKLTPLKLAHCVDHRCQNSLKKGPWWLLKRQSELAWTRKQFLVRFDAKTGGNLSKDQQ